ncbi:hypothetical protein DFH08DRAFT_935645 [Mycena albidolilacea]|uniref:Uncharacterized protein n=1 Tax=Mycena albidolilacea TaxID=1033008 RepID=A0AAD7EUR0_9AGAR|nr:hypothetical protein DFH08DRAFT_935645 [Mycena albidolilacea]
MYAFRRPSLLEGRGRHVKRRYDSLRVALDVRSTQNKQLPKRRLEARTGSAADRVSRSIDEEVCDTEGEEEKREGVETRSAPGKGTEVEDRRGSERVGLGADVHVVDISAFRAGPRQERDESGEQHVRAIIGPGLSLRWPFQRRRRPESTSAGRVQMRGEEGGGREQDGRACVRLLRPFAEPIAGARHLTGRLGPAEHGRARGCTGSARGQTTPAAIDGSVRLRSGLVTSADSEDARQVLRRRWSTSASVSGAESMQSVNRRRSMGAEGVEQRCVLIFKRFQSRCASTEERERTCWVRRGRSVVWSSPATSALGALDREREGAAVCGGWSRTSKAKSKSGKQWRLRVRLDSGPKLKSAKTFDWEKVHARRFCAPGEAVDRAVELAVGGQAVNEERRQAQRGAQAFTHAIDEREQLLACRSSLFLPFPWESTPYVRTTPRKVKVEGQEQERDRRGEVEVVVKEEEEEHATLTELGYFSPPAPLLFSFFQRGAVIGGRLDAVVLQVEWSGWEGLDMCTDSVPTTPIRGVTQDARPLPSLSWARARGRICEGKGRGRRVQSRAPEKTKEERFARHGAAPLMVLMLPLKVADTAGAGLEVENRGAGGIIPGTQERWDGAQTESRGLRHLLPRNAATSRVGGCGPHGVGAADGADASGGEDKDGDRARLRWARRCAPVRLRTVELVSAKGAVYQPDCVLLRREGREVTAIAGFARVVCCGAWLPRWRTYTALAMELDLMFMLRVVANWKFLRTLTCLLG